MAEDVTGHGAGGGGHRRDGGVVLHGHGLQGEPCGTTGQGHPNSVEGELHRLGRQAPTDVRKESTTDQGSSLVADLRRERGSRRGLVVEGRQDQALVTGIDQEAGQDRGTGPDREATSRPGDSVGENIAFDSELHGVDPSQGSGSSRCCGRGLRTAGAVGIASCHALGR